MKSNDLFIHFCRRSSTGTWNSKKSVSAYIGNVCVRSANSRSRTYVGKLGKSKKLDHKCPAHITIFENSWRAEGK